MAEVKLHPDWLAAIGGEFEQPYMAALKQFLAGERAKGKAIYPRPRDWFAALDATPPRDVRVVILGQDPYHGPGATAFTRIPSPIRLAERLRVKAVIAPLVLE